MKIALYIGRFRFPTKPTDIGIEFFESIKQSKHNICALLVEPDDPLVNIGKQLGLNVIPLPAQMRAPIAEMRAFFAAPPFEENVELFLQRIHDADPDIGVVYCGGWIPPALRVCMPLGFINLHPGPLPDLSGYDPEKFMIMNDYPVGHGTIHRTADLFDTGNILSFTPPVQLPPYTTTPELAGMITRSGFPVLREILDGVTNARSLLGTPQDESRRGYATRKLGYLESVIRWEEDSHRKLNCRLRAFNSLDDGMPLKIQDQNEYRIVYDLKTLSGDFPGKPGEQIGTHHESGSFHRTPIYRTIEGAAILRLGPAVPTHDTDFTLTEDQLIRPGHQTNRTNLT